MILDHLNNAKTYLSVNPLFERAFTYLHDTDFSKMNEGRHDIDGQNLFALVQSYTTKPDAAGRWESHRTYADIQFIISGRERIGLAPLHAMTPTDPYDPERDIIFHTGPGHFFTLDTHHFAIFFPHDVHMPSLALDEPATVKKVVFKVRI